MNMENPFAQKYRIPLPEDYEGSDLLPIISDKPEQRAISRLELLPPYIKRELVIEIIKQEFGL